MRDHAAEGNGKPPQESDPEDLSLSATCLGLLLFTLALQTAWFGSVGLVDPMSSLAIVQDCSMRRLVVDDSPL